MTNHWRDIRNADLILINGGNPAEAHPVGFRWFMKAKVERGAKMIHVDPRFTRTTAVSDIHLRIRTGTDAAFFGGLINYVLQNDLFHEEYVREYTNAAFVVDKSYSFDDGNVVNRCEGIAFAGGAAFSNEEGYLATKLMRGLGLVFLEQQARV